MCCRRGRTHDGLAAQPPSRVGVPRRRWRGRPEARWAPVLGSRSSPAFVVLVGGSGFWHERSRHPGGCERHPGLDGGLGDTPSSTTPPPEKKTTLAKKSPPPRETPRKFSPSLAQSFGLSSAGDRPPLCTPPKPLRNSTRTAAMALVPPLASAGGLSGTGAHDAGLAPPPTPHANTGRRLSKAIMRADSQDKESSKSWGTVTLRDGRGMHTEVRSAPKAFFPTCSRHAAWPTPVAFA